MKGKLEQLQWPSERSGSEHKAGSTKAVEIDLVSFLPQYIKLQNRQSSIDGTGD